MCEFNKQKLVAMATTLERSQPNFTAIFFVYGRKATNSENFAKIGQVLSQIIGAEPIIKTGSSFGS